ncbi:beta-2 adrenergic receptor-like [Diachasmimorpha longicaudata]|uniref:beta-2 adrenergic receptor-like n=1 Tax=Diachasmimorpha longicaudata TaxID=58733 RepID=UPI0030B90087
MSTDNTTNLLSMRENTMEHSNASKIDVHSIRDLYFYGTLPLIFFCIISIVVNIKILVCVYWIRKPLSPTLKISVSLAGADAFSSAALGGGLVGNSFIPIGLGLEFPGAACFLLGLEVIRIGALIITLGHLFMLAINHYLGILRPLHYASIMTHRMITLLIIVLWTLPLCFFMTYFNLMKNEGFQSPGCQDNTFLRKEKFRVMFSSLFFGPFVIMVCIYAHIFHIVREHQALRLRFSRGGLSVHKSGSDEKDQHVYHRLVKNVKAIHTTLFILGNFVVGWMPATFLFVLVCDDCLVKSNWITGYSKFIIFNAANCLLILRTIVNPIIYAARMHEIQAATERMHSSFRGLLGVRTIPGERNSIALQSSEAAFSRRASATRFGDQSGCQVAIDNNRYAQNKYLYTYAGPDRQRDHTTV